MATHIASLAIAVVVVDKLDTILRSRASTGITQAFVDIAFATRPDKSRRTCALEASDFVYTGSVVVARAHHAIVHVNFTDDAKSAMRAGAQVVVNFVVACPSILARIW